MICPNVAHDEDDHGHKRQLQEARERQRQEAIKEHVQTLKQVGNFMTTKQEKNKKKPLRL